MMLSRIQRYLKPHKAAARRTEAVPYRESYTGRIAAMYHNTRNLSNAREFTLILRASFTICLDQKRLMKLLCMIRKHLKLIDVI